MFLWKRRHAIEVVKGRSGGLEREKRVPGEGGGGGGGGVLDNVAT